MTLAGPITSVVIVGGGITAWSAASALKRRIPTLDVTLVATSVASNALADRMISSLPSIRDFHGDIGLTEEDTVVRAGSGVRLGTWFEGWAGELTPYVHAYGAYGAPVGGVPFHQLWLRDHGGAQLSAFDRFSAAAELARSALPLASPPGNLPSGLQLSRGNYSELMRAYARHLGVTVLEGSIKDLHLRTDDGFVERLLLDDHREINADLFIDATGPKALLHSRMDGEFIDWGQWLPCDRVLTADGPADPTAIAMDRVTATPFGWGWAASSPTASSSGWVYSSVHASDDAIASEIGGRPVEMIELRQGRTRDFWVRNCVAIGDAAIAVEPLEWTNLHLVHSQIDRLIAMMPGADCAPIELSEFNRQCAGEADRVRDFLCLHYVCARRSEPFWKDAAAITPSPALAHSLQQFARRGRLPFYEEETFARDSWLAVLFGQGFVPQQPDPLADQVPTEQAAEALGAMRQAIERSPASFSTSTPVDLNPRGAR